MDDSRIKQLLKLLRAKDDESKLLGLSLCLEELPKNILSGRYSYYFSEYYDYDNPDNFPTLDKIIAKIIDEYNPDSALKMYYFSAHVGNLCNCLSYMYII